LKTSGTPPTQISLGLAVNGAIPNQDTWGRVGEGTAGLDDNSQVSTADALIYLARLSAS
jgi:hypothetical protein